MKITAQEEYGLRCLLRLARSGEGHSLTIPEVAAAEGLSVPYVAKLLSVLRQGGFDFTGFDAVAADFHLMVDAAHKLQVAIGSPAGEVAGFVQPRRPARAEGVRDKFFRGQIGMAKVTARQAITAEAKLAGHTDGHGLALLVVGLLVGFRGAGASDVEARVGCASLLKVRVRTRARAALHSR